MRRRLRQDDNDEGMALVTVLGTMVVLTVFALGSLAFALKTLPGSRSSQDAVAAMAAAQAGIDEYVSRLNVNPAYYSTPDATNPALTAAGATVPGGAGAGVRFRYSLLTTTADTASTGVIRLKSTGTSNGVSRTLTATLTQEGFLRFIYFTDIETLDPKFWNTDQVPARVNGSYTFVDDKATTDTLDDEMHVYLADKNQVDAACVKKYYEGRKSPTYTSSASAPYLDYNAVTKVTTTRTNAATVTFSCSEIQFTGGDVINGPLHSNDALQINGSTTFTSAETESSWPACQPGRASESRCWWGSGTPGSNKPHYAAPLPLPRTNAKLRDAASSGAGCTYQGETKITFIGTQMKVWSPQTTVTRPECLDTASRATEQTKNIPSVIYVEDATSTCTSGVGYPIAGEDATTQIGWDRETTEYNCQYGTAFVSGTVQGQVTVATARDIVVVGDIKYQNDNRGSDVLGLIPNNSVWVHNPVNSSGQSLLTAAQSVHRIDAAILCLNHSFLVQNWNLGSPRSPSAAVTDKLTVNGAIAQKSRGPVGTGGGSSTSTGYLKNYVYDARLRHLPPPFFLAPEGSPWTVSQVTDG